MTVGQAVESEWTAGTRDLGAIAATLHVSVTCVRLCLSRARKAGRIA